MASIITLADAMRGLGGRRALVGVVGLLVLAGCSRAYVAPVLPSAYTEQIEAPYDAVWRALVRALARENVQIRTIARDSGVIASEAVPTTIGLYADCGRFGEERVQGDAQVAFTTSSTRGLVARARARARQRRSSTGSSPAGRSETSASEGNSP